MIKTTAECQSKALDPTESLPSVSGRIGAPEFGADGMWEPLSSAANGSRQGVAAEGSGSHSLLIEAARLTVTLTVSWFSAGDTNRPLCGAGSEGRWLVQTELYVGAAVLANNLLRTPPTCLPTNPCHLLSHLYYGLLWLSGTLRVIIQTCPGCGQPHSVIFNRFATETS